MNQQARQIAGNTGVAALLMLVFGWGVGLTGTSKSELYNLSVDVFNWTLRIGGFALVGVSITCFSGLRVGLLLDFLVSGMAGSIMVVCGCYWLSFALRGGGFDLQDFLVLIFGVMFVRAALHSWSLFGIDEAARAAAPHADSTPEPIHPASIRPGSLPGDGAPPPPEGYLAALSKEKDEPPSASYE